MTTIAQVRTPSDLLPAGKLGWHRHHTTMLALPKKGCYEEVVLRGGYKIQQGLIVVTPAYVVHADQVGRAGAQIENWSLGIDPGIAGVFELPHSVNAFSLPQRTDELTNLFQELTPVELSRPAHWLSDAFDRFRKPFASTFETVWIGHICSRFTSNLRALLRHK